MSGSPPTKKTTTPTPEAEPANPFTSGFSPIQSPKSPPAEASASTSPDASQPAPRQQARGQARVRFGSGEALDELGSRTAFQLPEIHSPESSRTVQRRVPSTDRYAPNPRSTGTDSPRQIFQSPVGTPRSSVDAERLMNYPEPISVPAKSFGGYKAVRIDDLERQAATESGNPFIDPNSAPASPEIRPVYGGSLSEPNSARSSPTLQGYIRPNVALGEVNEEGLRSQIDGNFITKEADMLVRNHTQRHYDSHLRNRELRSYVDREEYSGYNTPVIPEHPDEYVPKPKQYRHGVLGSLLTLYQDEGRGRGSRGTTPTSSGRTTPKWYSKSANSSVVSHAQLLAATGAALGGAALGGAALGSAALPAVGTRTPRPRLKHRPHSGTFAEKIKYLSRPNVGEEIRVREVANAELLDTAN